MIRIGDDVAVLPEHIEDRKAVRSEGTDAARRLLSIQRIFSLKALLAESQGRAPHPRKVFADNKLR